MKVDPVPHTPATLSDAPQALPAFVQFGRFQLVARLGKGGMGDVFLAVAPGMEGANKLLVVKRLHESFIEDSAMRSLFLAEGRLATRLNHPNVVQTYEVGEEAGVLYLSMEYLEGQPLSQLNKKLGDSQIDPKFAARIMSEALAGLHYAHELRDYSGKSFALVHRDVSPQNVFVTYDGITKMLDFGIAKVADQDQKTQAGILKGKIAYMAPEQVNGEVDRRSDVYSAGVVLWELLARRRLMAEATPAKTLARVMSGPPAPRLSMIQSDIDPLLEAVVARALERNPDNRFQTAQAMRDALEAYLAKRGTFVRQEDLSSLMAGFFGKRRERVADQVSSFMSAARESDSLLELPTIKGVTVARTSSGTGTGTGTGMTPSVTTQGSSITEGSESSVRNVAARDAEANPTVRPGAVFSGQNARPGSWTSGRVLILAALVLAGVCAAAVAWRSRTDAAATAPDKGRAITPERLAPVPEAAPASPVAVNAEQAESQAESAAPAPKRATGKARAQVSAASAPATKPVSGAAPAPGEKATKPTEPAPVPTPATPGKRKYRTDF